MHFKHNNSALEIHERCHSLSRFMHTINVFRYYCVLGYIPLTVKSTHRSVPSSSTTRHWIIFLLITLRFVLLGLGSDAAAASIASGSPALRALRLLRKRNIFGGLPCRVEFLCCTRMICVVFRLVSSARSSEHSYDALLDSVSHINAHTLPTTNRKQRSLLVFAQRLHDAHMSRCTTPFYRTFGICTRSHAPTNTELDCERYKVVCVCVCVCLLCDVGLWHPEMHSLNDVYVAVSGYYVVLHARVRCSSQPMTTMMTGTHY